MDQGVCDNNRLFNRRLSGPDDHFSDVRVAFGRGNTLAFAVVKTSSPMHCRLRRGRAREAGQRQRSFPRFGGLAGHRELRVPFSTLNCRRKTNLGQFSNTRGAVLYPRFKFVSGNGIHEVGHSFGPFFNFARVNWLGDSFTFLVDGCFEVAFVHDLVPSDH